MNYKILLGGYTSRLNKGVAEITLDTQKKELRDYHLLAEIVKPTYLLAKEDDIYACMQVGEEGGIAKIQDNKIVKSLTLSKVSPCHISYDQDRDYFYLSNYHEGLLFVVKETENGFVELDRVAHQGSGVHPNQEKSHIHFAQVSPCGKLLLACDLGTDEVYVYRSETDGKLTELCRFKTPDGFGPRHLAFHTHKPLVYVFGELSNQILVLKAETEKGELSNMQLISSLPADFSGWSAGAAIRLSRDGRFLYASNRGHNSIVVCKVEESGEIEPTMWISTEGNFPRDFALSPDGDYLVAAHQNSDNLTLFAVDRQTGRLSLLQKEIAAPECVCVHFKESERGR